MKQTVVNTMIGKRVIYSVTKQENGTGVILDKIDKKDKPEDQFTVTGYIVEDENTHELVHLSHWRITKIIEKAKNTRGGYRDQNRI